MAIDVVTAATADRLSIRVLFEDSAEAVRWQVEQWKKESNDAFMEVAAPYPVDSPIALDYQPAPSVAFRANILSSAVAEFLRACLALALPPSAHAHAGNGIVHGCWNSEPTLPEVHEMLIFLRQFAVRHQGTLIVTRCPPEWKRELPIWGEPRGDLALMKKVKHEIDPKNLFNPGRFIVG